MKKFLKFIFLTVVIIFILFIIFIAFIPQIFSSNFGKNLLIEYLNTNSDYQVEIQKLNFSWFGKQEIQGLIVKDKYNRPHLKLNSLILEKPLMNFSFKDFKNLNVNDLNLMLYNSDSLDAFIAIKNIEGKVNVYGQEQHYELNGLTQKENLIGNFKITGKNRINQKDQGRELVLNGNFNQFPVSLLDEFLNLYHPSLNGIFIDILGEELNLVFEETMHAPNQNLFFNINSTNLQSELKFNNGPQKLYLLEPATIDTQISPTLFSRIFPLHHFILEHPVKGKLWIKKYEMNNEFSLQSLQNSDINLEFEFGETTLLNPIKEKEIRLVKIMGELFTNSNETVNLQLEIQGEREDHDLFLIKIDVNFDKKEFLKGNFNSWKLPFKIETKNVPPSIITEFKESFNASFDLIEDIFGSKLNGKIAIDKKNNKNLVNIDINGSQSSLFISGKFDHENFILEAPLLADLYFPETFFDKIGENSTLPIKIAKINNPIKIEIDPKNFNFPWSKNISEINIDNGRIQTDGILLKNSNPILKEFLSYIKFKPKDPLISIKHSPCRFSFQKGIFSFDKIESILLDKYAFSSEGNLDFLKEKVDVILTLSTENIGIKLPFKIINAPMIIKIPLKGTFDKPKLNLKKAWVYPSL